MDDLGVQLPDLTVDLGDVDEPWIAELRRIAPTSPRGQKRILSISHPLVYRMRLSVERGATWIDDESELVWLCAVRRRQEGSEDDAFAWFVELHSSGRLLPTDDDRLRDQAEEAVRTFRRLRDGVFDLVDSALAHPGAERRVNIDGWLPARTLALRDDGVEEIWRAISVRAVDGQYLRQEMRDLLFALLEQHPEPVVFEVRQDWPDGEVGCYEGVRLGMR